MRKLATLLTVRCVFVLMLMLALVTLITGQTAKAVTDQYPLKPPDTSSPRDTMKVFMDYMNRAYQTSLVKGFKNESAIVLLNRAAECLDLSEIAPNVVQFIGEETSLLLKEIFDRIELPPQ